MIPMPNNLNKMIQSAGMTKREVAALKGITPENLSRQVNGHTNITLQDAEHYAKILDCSPQDVLFPTPPVPIIGYCHIVECTAENNCFAPFGVHVERRISAGKTMGNVYLQSYVQEGNGAVIWSKEENYDGPWHLWHNAIEFIELEPVKNNFVSKNAIQCGCYALLEEPVEHCGHQHKLVHGVLYPEPGNLFTIHNNDTGLSIKGQKLIWASAAISVHFRPNLRGIEIIFDDKN